MAKFSLVSAFSAAFDGAKKLLGEFGFTKKKFKEKEIELDEINPQFDEIKSKQKRSGSYANITTILPPTKESSTALEVSKADRSPETKKSSVPLKASEEEKVYYFSVVLPENIKQSIKNSSPAKKLDKVTLNKLNAMVDLHYVKALNNPKKFDFEDVKIMDNVEDMKKYLQGQHMDYGYLAVKVPVNFIKVLVTKENNESKEEIKIKHKANFKITAENLIAYADNPMKNQTELTELKASTANQNQTLQTPALR